MPDTTVNTAFNSFLRDVVRLDPAQTSAARGSRDWLVSQMRQRAASNTDPLPALHPEEYVYFGSFARRTKARPLDDVDMMIILHAQSNWRVEVAPNRYHVHVPDDSPQRRFCFTGTDRLNSRLIINQFIRSLRQVPQYESSDLTRNQQAAVLRLRSQPWNFDIVPCFVTAPDNGRTFYLIPDGDGNWMGTDPRVDQERVTRINTARGGRVLDVIRLVKCWASRKRGLTLGSYLVEVLITNFYERNDLRTPYYLDTEFIRILEHLARHVTFEVQDPKGLEGNVNRLSWDERAVASDLIAATHAQARVALALEQAGEQAKAVRAWRAILGDDFGAS